MLTLTEIDIPAAAPTSARLNVPPGIALQAEALARAEAQLAAANAAVADAERAHRQATDRLAALNAEKTAITRRRAAGQPEAEDGARLALIAADAETLDGIVGETGAARDAAREKADGGRRMADAARQHLALAEDQEALPLLLAHTNELGRLLLAAIGEMAAVEARLGQSGRPAWAPSRPLYDTIRKHAAQHGIL